MNINRKLLTYLPLVSLLVLSACRQPDGPGRAGSADPWQEWTQRHQAMTEDYDSLRTWYDQNMRQIPADLQEMYRQMDQMHGQWNQMRESMMDDGRGMMGGRMGGGMMRSVHGMQEWDHQMLAMHQAMAQMHRETGQEDVARWHEEMMLSYRQMMGQLPDTVSQSAPASPEGSVTGSAVFSRQCASCHGENGEGFGRAFPPLAQSQWATGEKQRLIRILLHGLEGSVEVQGQRYNGMMPAFSARLSDEEAAAVLSHIRSSWGNEAPAISEEEVGEVREQYEDRRRPWSATDFE